MPEVPQRSFHCFGMGTAASKRSSTEPRFSPRVDQTTWIEGMALSALMPRLLEADLEGDAFDSTLIRVVSFVRGDASPTRPGVCRGLRGL